MAAVATTREPQARQTKEVRKALETAKLPRKVKDVVRQVLWKKLPVGKWMESIGMSNADKRPLCTRVEGNEHRGKQCSYLEVPTQLTRDLYHPIKDGQGKIIEPSRICLEQQRISLETEQGILVSTVVAALWRYRCKVRYQRTSASREGCLAWWARELRQWEQEEATTVLTGSMQRVRQAIRAWCINRSKLERRENPGIPEEPNKKQAQEERKQLLEQEIIDRYNLLEPPREGIQRVWTDGSEQEEEDGKQYAGYSAWFGEGHTLNVSDPLEGSVQTNNRAELTAAIEVLRSVPKTMETQLSVDSQLMTLWLEGRGRRGWKTKQGQPIKNVDLWQQLYDTLQSRRAEQEWVKVPSHVDLEGSDREDKLVDEGVKKHMA